MLTGCFSIIFLISGDGVEWDGRLGNALIFH